MNVFQEFIMIFITPPAQEYRRRGYSVSMDVAPHHMYPVTTLVYIEFLQVLYETREVNSIPPLILLLSSVTQA
jgi:hypothetical protein